MGYRVVTSVDMVLLPAVPRTGCSEGRTVLLFSSPHRVWSRQSISRWGALENFEMNVLGSELGGGTLDSRASFSMSSNTT